MADFAPKNYTGSSFPPVPSFQSALGQQPRGTGSATARTTPTTSVGEEWMAERIQIFYEFLDSQKSSTDGLEYKEKVRGLIRRGDARLIVNLNDVRHFNVDYAKG